MGDFDKKYNIVDEKTPPHELLSGHYKQSVIFYSYAWLDSLQSHSG